MTDENDNHDELDEKTRETIEEIDRLEEEIDRNNAEAESAEYDRSGSMSSDRYPQGSRSENTVPEPPNFDSADQPSSGGDSDDDGDEAPSNFIGWLLVSVLKLWSYFVLVPISKLPRRTKIYQGMIKAGYQGMYKNTGANIIVNSIYKDRYMIPRPAEVDDKEGKVKTSNGEEWTMPDGLQDYRIGDASIMFGVSDAHELVDPVAARTAEKIDLDDAVYVQSAQQRQQQATYAGGPSPSAAGAQQARADGGMTGLTAKSLGQWNGEPFEDVFVNWANTNPDADGMIVSLEKHYELQHSQAGSEEMKKAEDRGRLSERLQDGKKTGLIYLAIFIGGSALGLFGPGLANSLGGGDGGSSISLMIWHGLTLTGLM